MAREITLGPETRIVRLGGRPSRALTILLALLVGLFLFCAFTGAPAWLVEHLSLSVAKALGLFELWQPLTAPWLHVDAADGRLQLDSRNLLLNALILWIFGGALERWWGSRRFVVFWLTCGVCSMGVALVVGLLSPNQLISGSAGPSTATLIAFSVLFAGHLPFIHRGVLPMRAKWLGIGLLAFIVIGNLVAGATYQVVLQAGGAITAALFLNGPKKLVQQLRLRRAKRRFKIIEGKKTSDSKYLN